MAPETKNIGDVLTQLMETENISVDKLADQTNIPERFIIALKEGEFAKLPAEPYVRGYLIKIAPVLKVESETLIQSYKDSAKTWKNKTVDELPGNVYAKTPVKKGLILGGIVLVAALSFLGFRLNDILGVPNLALTIPETSTTDTVTVSGQVRPGDKVTLNGEVVYTDEAGKFEHQLILTPGVNTFEFDVTRFLGQTVKIVKQVTYNPPAPTSAPTPAPAPGKIPPAPQPVPAL